LDRIAAHLCVAGGLESADESLRAPVWNGSQRSATTLSSKLGGRLAEAIGSAVSTPQFRNRQAGHCGSSGGQNERCMPVTVGGTSTRLSSFVSYSATVLEQYLGRVLQWLPKRLILVGLHFFAPRSRHAALTNLLNLQSTSLISTQLKLLNLCIVTYLGRVLLWAPKSLDSKENSLHVPRSCHAVAANRPCRVAEATRLGRQ
jgi:hypothetical protein